MRSARVWVLAGVVVCAAVVWVVMRGRKSETKNFQELAVEAMERLVYEEQFPAALVAFLGEKYDTIPMDESEATMRSAPRPLRSRYIEFKAKRGTQSTDYGGTMYARISVEILSYEDPARCDSAWARLGIRLSDGWCTDGADKMISKVAKFPPGVFVKSPRHVVVIKARCEDYDNRYGEWSRMAGDIRRLLDVYPPVWFLRCECGEKLEAVGDNSSM